MHELFSSPILIPVAAIATGCILGALGIWNKMRLAELAHDRDMEEKRMAHQLRMKEMELEKARLEAQPR